MKQDDLDRILSSAQDIVPSSGFTLSVLEAVRSEAATPPPIPFPWKRALPGIAAAGFAVLSVLVLGIEEIARPTPVPPSATLTAALASILDAAKTGGAGWILLALLLTLVSTLLSMRLAD